MIICVDFDGTIVTHMYPEIGQPVPKAVDTMKELLKLGHRIILYTMRSGKELEEAVAYCKDNGIDFWGVNENPEQKEWTNSPKVYAHIYIDDASLDAVLCTPMEGETRGYYDWNKAREWLFGNTAS